MDSVVDNPNMALLTGICCIAATALLLPEHVVVKSEVLWAIREYLRRNLRQIVQLTMQGPCFKLLVFCAKRCSRGYLSSPCRPPHSLKAQAISGGQLVLCWTARHPTSNPFHEEWFVCAWRLASDSTEDPVSWHEWLVEENGNEEAEGDRWMSFAKGLPPGACIRLRVCAVNRYGRGDWSKEEIEIDLPAGHREAGGGRGLGQAPTRSRTVACGDRLCLQCRTPQPARCSVAYADVVCRPLFARDCPHGPFCARCRQLISAQVLPSCICRALIGAWREAESGGAKPA